jgi:hypothetical protein
MSQIFISGLKIYECSNKCCFCAENLKTRDWNLMETHEESVTSYRSFLWVGNLIADKKDSDRRNIQASLADWVR